MKALTCVSMFAVLGSVSAVSVAEEPQEAEEAMHHSDKAEGYKPTEHKESAHGMSGAVIDALKSLDLKPEQKEAVKALLVDSDVEHAQLLDSKRKLKAALADQVQTGRIEPNALAPLTNEVAEEWACARADNLAFLQALHGVLDTNQRAQFADA